MKQTDISHPFDMTDYFYVWATTRLLPELQDEIAKQILEDVESELKWQSTLAKPQSKLEKLAEKTLAESKA